MKTALVTGGTGFIGSRLIGMLLSRGWKVQAAARTPESAARLPRGVEALIVGELSASADWSGLWGNLDAVFHLAGKAHDTASLAEAAEYERVNVAATGALAAACVRAGARRFVFFSSVKAGEADTPYGRSKKAAEETVLTSGLSAVCLRLSLVYGPGQKGNLLRLVRQIDRGCFPALRWVDNRRSLVHVDNVVQASLLAAEAASAAGRTYVVTDARDYSTAELCRLIRSNLGRGDGWDLPEPALRALAVVGDAIGRLRGRPFVFDSAALAKLCGDARFRDDRIASELGYQPREDLGSAMPQIIAAYRTGLL